MIETTVTPIKSFPNRNTVQKVALMAAVIPVQVVLRQNCLHLSGTGKGRNIRDLMLFIFSPVCIKVHLPVKNGHWLEKKSNISLHRLPVVLHHGHHL